MRIQTIQSTNNNKTNFKARFINDKNGNFLRFWNDALKSRDLLSKAKNFSDVHPYDVLEIIGLNETDAAVKSYDVFNHNTGVTSSYKTKATTPKNKVLEFLLDSIDDDKNIFNNDFSTMMYNLLLGRK